MLTAETLRELVDFDPETGVFTWRKARHGIRPGKVAGCKQARYWLIGLEHKFYYAHRLAWLYMTGAAPVAEIDHIDGDGHNNKWSNLRAANRCEQLQNTRRSRRNKSGHKGVSWDARRQKWVAQIVHQGRHKHLGRFGDLEDAASAYAAAKARLHTFHPTVERGA